MRTISPVAFLYSDHPFASRATVELAGWLPITVLFEGICRRALSGIIYQAAAKPEHQQRVTSLEMMRSLAHGFGIGISYSHRRYQL